MKLKQLITATAKPITHHEIPAVSNVQIVARAAESYAKTISEIHRAIHNVHADKDQPYHAVKDIEALLDGLKFELMILEKAIV